MHHNVFQSNNTSNNKTYVPPRHRTSNNVSTPTSTPTEKKSLKKEFSLANDQNAFPSLSSHLTPAQQPFRSFAQATTQTAPVSPNSTAANLFKTVPPGWVYIRNNNGQIQYKYGPADYQRYSSATSDDSDTLLAQYILKYRLAKEQYVRDNDISRLGDLSEYYQTKTLHEMFDEEEERILLKTEYSISDISDID